jgi:hypothetical protein
MVRGLQEGEEVQTLHVFFKDLAEVGVFGVVSTEIFDLGFSKTKHVSPTVVVRRRCDAWYDSRPLQTACDVGTTRDRGAGCPQYKPIAL